MAQQKEAADAHLFHMLSTLVQQVEALTNEEEVELRSKIEALSLEVTKLPQNSTPHNHNLVLDQLEIARELDTLSAKLDQVDQMVSSADPQVQQLLTQTAHLWLPVITANGDQRRNFTPTTPDHNHDDNHQSHST